MQKETLLRDKNSLLFFNWRVCLLFFGILVSLAENIIASPEDILGYEFQDKSLRKKALQPRTQEFERLEFLGDRILGLATAHLLYKNFPLQEISWLTNSFQTIVSNPSLFKIYQDFEIDSSELISPHYNAPLSSIAQKTASDIVESLIGAIYVEAGYQTAQACCEKLIKRYYDFTPQKESLFLTRHALLSAFASKRKNNNQPDKFNSLQESLAYYFNDEGLLHNAFRHPSVGGCIFKTFDFIGVRVLSLVVAEKVFNEQSEDKEGRLMQSLERTINNTNIEKAFQRWQLWRYLEKQRQNNYSSLLHPERVSTREAVDTVRSFIGSVYLDGGWKSAQLVTHKLLFSEPSKVYIKPNSDKLSKPLVSTQVAQLSNAIEPLKPQIETTLEASKEWPSLKPEKTTEKESQSLKVKAESASNSPTSITQSSSDIVTGQLSYRQALDKKVLKVHAHKTTPSKQEEWPALGEQNQNQSKLSLWSLPGSSSMNKSFDFNKKTTL